MKDSEHPRRVLLRGVAFDGACHRAGVINIVKNRTAANEKARERHISEENSQDFQLTNVRKQDAEK